MSRVWNNRLALVGGIILLLLAMVALAAPWLAPHDPLHVNLPNALLPPSAGYPLGTDQLGRDVLSRLIYGTRISLLIGLIAVGIAVLMGTVVGALAGFYGGWVDAVLMRLVDTLLAIPTIFLLLSVIAMDPAERLLQLNTVPVLGGVIAGLFRLVDPHIVVLMAVIGAMSWMGVARLIRAEILSLKEREFVLAARVLGASPLRVMTKHLIPNAMGPVLVSATLGVGGAILTESVLSYLGLGVQPPTPSWGNILNEGRVALGVAWWLTLSPGLCILVTVLAFNLLGEGIREWVNRR
ncbi:MAG: ABC transporter permease [Candidatus Omnitrophota bacterium]|nr:ABC transporter permease [Candidatus Omnitrophota bacterium]